MLSMHITKNDPMPQEADKPHDRTTAWALRANSACIADAEHLGKNNTLEWGVRLSDEGIDETVMKQMNMEQQRPNAFEVARTIAAENRALVSNDLPEVRRALKEAASLEYIRSMAGCPEVCVQATMSGTVVMAMGRNPGFDVSPIFILTCAGRWRGQVPISRGLCVCASG